MSSRASSVCLALLLAMLSGCYKVQTCGEELCDLVDNDCDSRIDEDFVDENGVYFQAAHCGACGVDCASELPTAQATECIVDAEAGTAMCALVECPAGFHTVDDRSCAPDVAVRCLPCLADNDCNQRFPSSRCVELPGEGLRCFEPCLGGCPEGFVCTDEGEESVCVPESGVCACTKEAEGTEFACLFESESGGVCAGVQECTPFGLAACEAGLTEACNAFDDDCDDEVDEDFVVDGVYLARLHCGACNVSCVEPGPNMTAVCSADAGSSSGASCDIDCEDGFVDVDGLPANGCECERFDGTGAAPPVGSDADCDGDPDDDDAFIYVRVTGNDSNPGTLIQPMRSIQAAIARGQTEDKDVLVAVGVYEGGVDVVPGVSVFGGYRVDFRVRDPALFPVVLEHRTGTPGLPVVTCTDVSAPTELDGFEVRATDSLVVGVGSTALYLDRCTDSVVFRNLLVVAGRGADGVRGQSSSDRIDDLGLDSLEELKGVDGTPGLPGTSIAEACSLIAAGAGGAKACPAGAVSGGDGGNGDCPVLGCSNGAACGNSGCTDYTVGGVCDFDAMLAVAIPNPPASDGLGTAPGAAGEVTYDSPTNRAVCSFCDDNPTLRRFGDDGGDGATGDDGTGGLGCGVGPVNFDFATGLLGGLSGGDGTPGTDGSGGGGGTAGGGYAVIDGTAGICSSRSGGSGGGGGSGGCGAPAALGGFGGGGSIAIAIRMPSGATSGPVLEAVRVLTASGGRGGDGGVGASGGTAGGGANGGNSTFWCAKNGGRGGDGGRGGAGGGGGGGCGGGSHGVFVDGRDALPDAYAASLGASVTVDATGVPGAGGGGGFAPNASGQPGSPGDGTPIFILR